MIKKLERIIKKLKNKERLSKEELGVCLMALYLKRIK